MKGKKSVLIIEDNIDERELLQIVFKKKKFQVVPAKSILTATRQLNKRKFDMILLDLGLPDGSGMEILEKVNKDYKNRVIIITGQNDINVAVEAMKMGAFDFKIKPLDFPALIASVNKAMELFDEYEQLKQDKAINLDKKNEINHFGYPDITLKEVEELHISNILKKTNYGISETARILGISRTTLYRKMKEYKFPKIF